MKIAVVTYSLSTHSGARAPIEIARALIKLGHKVTIFATPKLYDRSLKLPHHIVANPLHLYQQLISEGAAGRNNFQLISFHGTLPYLVACRLTGIPVFSHYYGTQFISPPLNLLIYLITFLLVWLPHRIFAISNYCASECARLYGRKISTIYLGTTKLKKFAVKKSQSIQLLSVSRLVPYKNFPVLVNIVKKFPSVRLTIVGSSPDLKYLKSLKLLANKQIQILVNLPDAKLARLYASCDIYVTADKYLFFGLPILEAASHGKPTVAMDFAAAGELVIHGQTGFVAPHPTAFSHYLGLLITHPKLTAKLGRAARLYSRRFSWDTCAQQITPYAQSLQ